MSSDATPHSTLGVALGSGSARGLAHIGVLKALDESRIPIAYITGTSMGAIVGAFYATGALNRLEEFFLSLDWRTITSYCDFTFPQRGLIEGERITRRLDELLPVSHFEQTNIPFATVATDMFTGQEVRIDSGKLVDGIRASISLPGVFHPVANEGTYLLDGGLSNPIPVDMVREMGADRVLTVDLNHDLEDKNTRKRRLRNPYLSPKDMDASGKKDDESALKNARRNGNGRQLLASGTLFSSLQQHYHKLGAAFRERFSDRMKDEDVKSNGPNIFDVLGSSMSIVEYHLSRTALERHGPEFIIRPEVAHLNLFDYDSAEETIHEGYRKTMEALPEIRKAVHA